MNTKCKNKVYKGKKKGSKRLEKKNAFFIKTKIILFKVYLTRVQYQYFTKNNLTWIEKMFRVCSDK